MTDALKATVAPTDAGTQAADAALPALTLWTNGRPPHRQRWRHTARFPHRTRPASRDRPDQDVGRRCPQLTTDASCLPTGGDFLPSVGERIGDDQLDSA